MTYEATIGSRRGIRVLRVTAQGRTRAYWMALGHAIADGYGPFAHIVVKEA